MHKLKDFYRTKLTAWKREATAKEKTLTPKKKEQKKNDYCNKNILKNINNRRKKTQISDQKKISENVHLFPLSRC